MYLFVSKIYDLKLIYSTIYYTFGPQCYLYLSLYVTIFKQNVHVEIENLRMDFRVECTPYKQKRAPLN